MWTQTRVTTSLDAISVCVCVATWLRFLGSLVTALWPAATPHQSVSTDAAQALAAALQLLFAQVQVFPLCRRFPASVICSRLNRPAEPRAFTEDSLQEEEEEDGCDAASLAGPLACPPLEDTKAVA